MSKVFRLYKGGTTTFQGWNDNPAFPYNSNARDTIEDPDGASAKNEITSIPSPFARIDLVKTAFKEVCRRASQNLENLDGNTIFHKMVSDSLDVGEIFFNIDKFRDKISIITWDPTVMIDILKNDQNVSHYYVADALEKYLVSDAITYNFNRLKNIYLLNYTNGPDELNIIGATSPATLFFSGANSLEYIQIFSSLIMTAHLMESMLHYTKEILITSRHGGHFAKLFHRSLTSSLRLRTTLISHTGL